MTDTAGAAVAQAVPFGYGPSDIQSAYSLPASTNGTGQTIAIVDAFDDPRAEADLATYRTQYGLAPCTTANGCFKKVSQTGTSAYPAADAGWAEEISLDLDMASAACPNCHILLVEARSDYFSDLGIAEDYAAAHGTVVSDSYGGDEFSTETATSIDSHYNHPGVPIAVATGDNGYGVEYPAASSHVTAVGGTSLSRAPSTSRGWTETAWSDAGSGCSRFVAKPSWQHDTGCARRTVADVSAVADPNTGVAVYDTYVDHGWMVFGGTSAATPIIAATYALIGNVGASAGGSYFYGFPTKIFDVTGGSNGACSPSYLCTAVVGFDGPTGLGTPNLGLTAPPPPQAPTVVTGASSGVTSSGATIAGTVNPNGQATSYHFEYGTSATPYSSSTTTLGAGSGTTTVGESATLTGLAASTTYHYRLVASNATGPTNGADQTFTTPAVIGPPPPPPPSGSAVPSSVVISTGTLASGSAASLGAADGSYFGVASTRTVPPTATWYGSMLGVPEAATSLSVTYTGATTQNSTQTISVYNFTTAQWVTVGSRATTSTPATATFPLSGVLSNYVSGSGPTGELRVQISSRNTAGKSFTVQGDLLQVSWTT